MARKQGTLISIEIHNTLYFLTKKETEAIIKELTAKLLKANKGA